MSDGAHLAGAPASPEVLRRADAASAVVTPPSTTVTTPTPASHPSIVAEVTGEITPGSAPVWQPASYAEWKARERLTTYLAAWAAQATDERALRRTFARWIFALITVQIVAAFSIVTAGGLGWLHVDVTLLKILIPAVLAEVFGLGYVVTKYLFSLPIRHSLDVLAQGAPQEGGPRGTALSGTSRGAATWPAPPGL